MVMGTESAASHAGSVSLDLHRARSHLLSYRKTEMQDTVVSPRGHNQGTSDLPLSGVGGRGGWTTFFPRAVQPAGSLATQHLPHFPFGNIVLGSPGSLLMVIESGHPGHFQWDFQ